MEKSMIDDVRMLEAAAERAYGKQPWFMHMDWHGDLNGQSVEIKNKKGDVLFKIEQGGSSLAIAEYICKMNNVLYKLMNVR
jgi:hypothetical protein